ncbi:MAG: hypothetical protein ABIQ57_14580 [Candidatus Kapaibacterium sp.]
MSQVRLTRISGRGLRWIRRAAGWSRDRLADIFRREREYEGDFQCVKSIERHETLPVVSPLVVSRYRTAISQEVFDDLLEEARIRFPEMNLTSLDAAMNARKTEESQEVEEEGRTAGTARQRVRNRMNEDRGPIERQPQRGIQDTGCA